MQLCFHDRECYIGEVVLGNLPTDQDHKNFLRVSDLEPEE